MTPRQSDQREPRRGTQAAVVRVLGLFDWVVEDPHNRGRSALTCPRFALPYRVDLLSDECTKLEIISSATASIHLKIRDVIEHRSGVKVDRFLRALPRASRTDLTLAFLEDQLTAPSWMRRRGVWPWARQPLAGISCWWAEELRMGTRSPGEVRAVMEGVDKLFVFSRNQVAIFTAAGVPAEKIVPVAFGVDPAFYRPRTSHHRFQVFAAGIDRGRDWPTLAEAARLLPHVQFDVVTHPHVADQVNAPPNFRVHSPVDLDTHRASLASADVVVVPTHELAYPTGQSVMLEGMASGACVAVTATDAMSEYIADGEWNLAMPPGDPHGVADVIQRAVEDAELRRAIGMGGRRAVEERFTFVRMWDSIRKELRALL